MKIINKENAYIQKKDLLYLVSLNINIPNTIKDKINEVKVNNKNKDEFIEFNNSDEIEFIKNFKYIIDYNYIELDEDELIKIEFSIRNKMNNIKEKYTNSSKSKSIDLAIEYDLLEYKLYSINELIMLKKRNLSYKLPKDNNKKLKKLKK